MRTIRQLDTMMSIDEMKAISVEYAKNEEPIQFEVDEFKLDGNTYTLRLVPVMDIEEESGEPTVEFFDIAYDDEVKLLASIKKGGNRFYEPTVGRLHSFIMQNVWDVDSEIELFCALKSVGMAYDFTGEDYYFFYSNRHDALRELYLSAAAMIERDPHAIAALLENYCGGDEFFNTPAKSEHEEGDMCNP